MARSLAAFGASVTFEGSCVFTPPLAVEQQRPDVLEPPINFNAPVAFDSSKYDAIMGSPRWAGALVVFESGGLIQGRTPEVAFEEAWNPGQQSTLRIAVVGDEWAIPSTGYTPPAPTTCPYPPQVVEARRSPRLYGNKPILMSLLLGASPLKMETFRLFTGMTYQKADQGDVPVRGFIQSIDDSIRWVDRPICFELQPFSGLRRGEIARLIAESIGIPPEKAIVPIGQEVTKPILLSNGSLLQFLNEFGVPENWYASFDEEGNLFVRAIELKQAPDPPDWTLDASLGDFDYESLEEVPPSKPAQRFYVTGTAPVPPGATGELVTVRIEEEAELYNPECVKVRPSGGASYLQGDGSYRILPAQELMVVRRKLTEVTTRDGLEIRRSVKRSAFYNPLAYDPNFNTQPPGTSYNGAYGNKTFHRDEAESLMEVSEELIETAYDIYGTIQVQTTTVKGWFAPHRAGAWASRTTGTLKNDLAADPPAHVFPGGTTRVKPVEEYGITQKTTKEYLFATDGSLASIVEKKSEWLSPTARCDVVQTTVVPDIGPPKIDIDPIIPAPDPDHDPPPLPPAPVPPPWTPALIGPTRRAYANFYFTLTVFNFPVGEFVTAATFELKYFFASSSRTQGSGPISFEGGSPSNNRQEVSFRIGIGAGTRPTGFDHAELSVKLTTNLASRTSNRLRFDPYSGMPPGKTLFTWP